MNKNNLKYDILWDQFIKYPSVQLKFGIKRKIFPLTKQFTGRRSTVFFVNNYIELKGKWDNSPEFGSLLSLKLTNITKSSIRITRLVFPMENGIDDFLQDFNPNDISFLRNGYQSWSTTRSYKITDKPLRPWLQLVSLTSSNLANLPSNTPGNLSSEMYSVICDLKKNEFFLVGQAPPFNQFFYIRLILYKKESKKSYFELVFDFGRKMLKSNETITLDGIIMAKGDTLDIQSKYFSYIKNQMKIKIPDKNIKGWSSWYYYYNKITPEIIYNNIEIIKKNNLNIDLIQIDDGYQNLVGDWLCLNPTFNNRMEELAYNIKKKGFIPGIWIAPFIADKKSLLATEYPDYIVKTEHGKPIIAGYNPGWNGKFYYGLDITNPRFEEYLREVIKTIVFKWGFKYLKLDFLFAGCLRGGNYMNFKLSRSEILKYGIKVIREESGEDTILAGCGMPLSTGIGTINCMRVGPDTAPYWKKIIGSFLQTGAMIGARNSIRNFLNRSFMNKNLWINDPDCLIVRETKTKLTKNQRVSQINAIILSGGLLLISDNLTELKESNFIEIKKIIELSDICFQGNCIPFDMMEQEIPEIIYNTAGYLGIFNFKPIKSTKSIPLSKISISKKLIALQDVWSDEIYEPDFNYDIRFRNMEPYSSKLLKIIY